MRSDSKYDEDYYDNDNNDKKTIEINKHAAIKSVRNIHIEIDEIVFDGFDRLDRNSIASVIEHDLSLLLSTYSDSMDLEDRNSRSNMTKSKQLSNKIRKISSIDACSFSISLGKNIDSKSIGSRISQVIFEGLTSTSMGQE